MQATIDEIRGRIKALDSQLDHEVEMQSNLQKSLKGSRKRMSDITDLRIGYVDILGELGESVYRDGPAVTLTTLTVTAQDDEQGEVTL